MSDPRAPVYNSDDKTVLDSDGIVDLSLPTPATSDLDAPDADPALGLSYISDGVSAAFDFNDSELSLMSIPPAGFEMPHFHGIGFIGEDPQIFFKVSDAPSSPVEVDARPAAPITPITGVNRKRKNTQPDDYESAAAPESEDYAPKASSSRAKPAAKKQRKAFGANLAEHEKRVAKRLDNSENYSTLALVRGEELRDKARLDREKEDKHVFLGTSAASLGFFQRERDRQIREVAVKNPTEKENSIARFKQRQTHKSQPVKYKARKMFADRRPRVGGRFVKHTPETKQAIAEGQTFQQSVEAISIVEITTRLGS